MFANLVKKSEENNSETSSLSSVSSTNDSVKTPILEDKGVVEVKTVVEEVKKEDRTSATAFKIKGLPDTYELKDEKGQPLGKAAVQTSELSQLLRQSIQVEGKKVKIQWYEEFERYKILGLLE